MRTMKTDKRLGLLALLGATATLLLAAAAPAFAAEPQWRIDSLAPSQVAPGDSLEYTVQMTNLGDAAVSTTPYTFTASLPAGIAATAVAHPAFSPPEQFGEIFCTGDGPGAPPGIAGATNVSCAIPFPLHAAPSGESQVTIDLETEVASEAALDGTTATAHFEVSGGGAAEAASTVDPTLIGSAAPAFGIDAFDFRATDAAGALDARAGAHPADNLTDVDLASRYEGNTVVRGPWPVEPVRDLRVDLPPGFVGNPSIAPRCSLGDLAYVEPGGSIPQPLCSSESQVGTIRLRLALAGLGAITSPLPLYNMAPPPGAAARFGFNASGTLVVLDAHLESDGGYRLSVGSAGISEALGIVGNQVDFWGVPADESHLRDRSCPGELYPWEGGPSCEGAPEPKPLLRNPTSCAPEPLTLHADSWYHPGAFDTRTIHTHDPVGYPHTESEWGAPHGTEECANVPFGPSVSVQPTSEQADSPTGLKVDLTMPQRGLEEEGAISESDLRGARVLLPEGMTVNPASATGQGACTAAQIGLTTPVGSSPVYFDDSMPSCPASSKIGTLSLETPLLAQYDAGGAPVLDEGHPVPKQLQGSVYLAAQGDNPFGSLLALYMVVEDEEDGVIVKLPGKVVADEQSGRLEAVFEDNPQLPFSRLSVDLFGGQRAALKTPAACGAYSATATLTPWSGGAAVQEASSFQITQGCGGGFAPKLSAGTQNPLAGQTSPFSLRITREDGEQELGGLTATLPPGLSGYLKGIPYCPDAALASISGELGTGVGQEQSPSCPAASRIGTVTVGAGAGANPFYTSSGRAYLAGPYKGAPLSIAVVAPAVAGPFDLGSVVVRNALRIDPLSAQITAISDPLPSILHGIPLDLRDVRVDLDRENFTLNPTSCEEMQIAGTIASTGGASASPSERFQVAGCENLAFKPKLAFRLHGKTKRSGHPGLRAVLTMPGKGAEANVSSVQVSLPHSEFVAQSHLADVCTRVQYAEGGGGGAGCPAKSVYGHAVAYSPLLDEPLRGAVYLRSNGGERELPDLVASLDGQIHIDLVGFIGTNKKTQGLRTTFATAPDAPVSKFVLDMPAGKHSLLENSTDICRGTHRAIVRMDAHDGALADSKVKLGVAGCRRHRKRGSHRGGHR